MHRCAIIILFIHISFAGRAQTNDITLLRDIYHNRNAQLDESIHFLTESVTPISIALPASLIIYGYLDKDIEIWDKGIKSALAIGSAMAVSYTLKYTINRQRPYEKYPDIVPYAGDFSSSLPSGHTTTAFATATTLTILKPEWYVIVPAYGYASLVAYSRMHLGMHYPSDLLMGALIGSGCSSASFKINKLLKSGFMYPRRK
jgi:membrane-associated phospholipid phosphatase